ncbi:MAG: right-handed parallel beta-helix repeat-containing protein [Clostridia bacterium]|nr:right-handed parallel beta-helix repeat-containing protein [Clostridia bacterium]
MENKDMTEYLQSLIDRAAEGDTVQLPAGTVYVSRPLVVRDKKNVKICGQDTHFLHTGYDMTNREVQADTALFVLEGCTGVTLENFSVDYVGFVSIAGTVLETNAGENPYFVMRLYPEFEEMTGEEYYRTTMSFDSDGAPNYHCSLWENEFSVEKIGKGLLKVSCRNAAAAERLSIGEAVNIRLSLKGAAVILNMASADTLFKDITIYQTVCGSFLIGMRSGSVTFDHVVITFKEGTRQLMSSNADAIHIAGMTGKLTVRNSVFDGLGDDAVNVHSRAGILTSVDVANKTVHFVDGWSKEPTDSTWAQAGDTVEFYDPKTFLPKGTAVVACYTGDTLLLDAVPETAAEGDVVANLAYLPSVHIADCIVTRNRARAFLIQTRNVVIENCQMNRISLPAIIVAPDIQRWFEVGPAQNVVIRNNTMQKCAFISDPANMGAIVVKASHDAGYADYPAGVHRDILIEGNTIDDTANSAIFVSATSGLTVRHNRIGSFGTVKNHLPSGEHAVFCVNCTEVKTENNTCEG